MYPPSLPSPQAGHIGPGGWRSAPQWPQRWTRSSPAAVPAQKNAVSGVICGRIVEPGSDVTGLALLDELDGLAELALLYGLAGLDGLAGMDGVDELVGPDGVAAVDGVACGGRNFRMRKFIVATGSPEENQVLRVVTNQPSPSAVRLGPTTSGSLDRTDSCSPS